MKRVPRLFPSEIDEIEEHRRFLILVFIFKRYLRISVKEESQNKLSSKITLDRLTRTHVFRKFTRVFKFFSRFFEIFVKFTFFYFVP